MNTEVAVCVPLKFVGDMFWNLQDTSEAYLHFLVFLGLNVDENAIPPIIVLGGVLKILCEIKTVKPQWPDLLKLIDQFTNLMPAQLSCNRI